MNLYLILNILIFGTLLLSFDKKVAFYKYIPFLSIGIIVNMLLFIPWDILFTKNEVWGFNSTYLIGLYIFNLPIEEWLFFVTVPYSCTFIHYVLKAYFKNPFKVNITKKIWLIIAFSILIIGLFNFDKIYTFTAFIICAITIVISLRIDKNFMNDFLFTYTISFIPFIVVNSILTGSFTEKPIVWYNNLENFGVRIGTIPIEDTIYNITLLIIPTLITHVTYNKYKHKTI